jgi:2-phosphosulfolactate phosphatase
VRVIARLEECPALGPEDMALIFDVLRASTAMVNAAFHGVAGILPVKEVDAARSLAAAHPGWRLAGERGNRPIPGFAYGNSPRDWDDAEAVGARVVWTTTNGTAAVERARGAGRLAIAAFINRAAAAELAAAHPGPVWLVAAGTRGQFALEDWLAAGAVADRLPWERWTDSARAAILGFTAAAANLAGTLTLAEHGRELVAMGLGDDVAYAARLDAVPIVLDAASPDAEGHRWFLPRVSG